MSRPVMWDIWSKTKKGKKRYRTNQKKWQNRIFIIKVLGIVLAKDLEMIEISADEINFHFLD